MDIVRYATHETNLSHQYCGLIASHFEDRLWISMNTHGGTITMRLSHEQAAWLAVEAAQFVAAQSPAQDADLVNAERLAGTVGGA